MMAWNPWLQFFLLLLLFFRKRRFFRSPGCMLLDMGGMWKKMHPSSETGPSIQVWIPHHLQRPALLLFLVGFMLFKNQDTTDKLNYRVFKVYFVFWLRIFKFYSLGKYQLYDRLLAIVSFYFYCMFECCGLWFHEDSADKPVTYLQTHPGHVRCRLHHSEVMLYPLHRNWVFKFPGHMVFCFFFKFFNTKNIVYWGISD